MIKIKPNNSKFLAKYEVKKVIQNDKYENRLLVIHNDKKVERSLKIIKREKYIRPNMKEENEQVMKQLQ